MVGDFSGGPVEKAGEAGKTNGNRWEERVREWRSPLAILVAGFLAFLTLSGLSIWLLPFNLPNQVMVFAHTIAGVALLIPCVWYLVRHWLRYWRNPSSHILWLGYIGAAALIVCIVSGGFLTYQAALGAKINYTWDAIHIITTLAILAFVLPHVLVIVFRDRKTRLLGAAPGLAETAGPYGRGTLIYTLAMLAVVAVLAYAYQSPTLIKSFPSDYSFKYGKNRPFAPSLATTDGGRVMDAQLLSGSRSCGTSGCHEQIVKEWEVSAHRYSAMDLAFQAIQKNMAQQNGPESTRYCGGCHDPISLFSGTKNLFIDPEKLTSLAGFQEGVSCLACHSVRKVDVKGNANYIMAEPDRYMFELQYDRKPTETVRFMRDFLIRAYPRHHLKDLSKTLFKTPEYCAACHKQFIDKEINNVGWVQLQNQYDNWRQSRWNHPGDPRKTIECRECHMPLVATAGGNPDTGDVTDYNRTANDGKHRSHRFAAANLMMPAMLKLPGWEKQVELTRDWLQGKVPIPEIADKWQQGPAVGLELETPPQVSQGDKVDVKLVITSNKVGHDFPTGPLDIIQAWVEFTATDSQGNVVYSSGTVNDKGFIQPGTFMFKAEPVDQNGNLIDRHNLWEMVGVRYRRSLFPGFSDTTEFAFMCPQTAPVRAKKFPQDLSYAIPVPKSAAGTLQITARLRYRKVDQYLLNFVFGEHEGLTSPITDMASDTRVIEIIPRIRGAAAGK
jgi:Cytochrome c554 and c-prime